MYQKSRRFQTKIITYAVLVIFSLLVIGVFVYSYVSKYQENKLDIKSRYTFSIRIDDQWNVIKSARIPVVFFSCNKINIFWIQCFLRIIKQYHLNGQVIPVAWKQLKIVIQLIKNDW